MTDCTDNSIIDARTNLIQASELHTTAKGRAREILGKPGAMPWEVFADHGDMVEVRTLDTVPKRIGFTEVGDECGFAEDVARTASDPTCGAVFFTVQNLRRYSLDESLRNKLANAKRGTAKDGRSYSARDKDFSYRRYCILDVDPRRQGQPDQTCMSTDAEKAAAWAVARNVTDFLSDAGWGRPVIVDSGSGYHLYWKLPERIHAYKPSDKKDPLRRLLTGLDSRFGVTDRVKIDPSVCNPSHVMRLPGTMSRKGPDTAERPHRMCKFLDISGDWFHQDLTGAASLEDLIAKLDAGASVISGPPPGARGAESATATALKMDLGHIDHDERVRRATAYLAAMPPGIQGQNGSGATYAAACALVHGFALPVEVALDILRRDYNPRCVPEWSEPELRHKVEDAMTKAHDQPRGYILARGSHAGPKTASDSQIIPPSCGKETRVIRVGTDELRMNDEAIGALKNHPDLFVRGGKIVRIVHEHPATQASGDSPRITVLSHWTLREYLTDYINWIKPAKNGEITVPPPMNAVHAILDRGAWSGWRRLTGLVEFPVILPGGEILTAVGYHAGTGLYYSSGCPVELTVADHPTREDARLAAAALLAVVEDFPFAEQHHKSAWLAALLTPIARHAFEGPAPFFLVDANVPGSGKSLLADVISVIVKGGRLATTNMPEDGTEFRKLVTSLLLRGESIVTFDDLGGRLAGRELNQLLTTTLWSDRILGESRDVQLPVLATFLGTGNNVAVHGDTLRRVCPIRLESPLERPEERADVRVRDLRAWVRRNRATCLSNALTVLRAYEIAGRPDAQLEPWGGYEGWSSVVRGAIVWAGQPDPWRGRQAMRESHGDDQIAALRSLFARWGEIDPEDRGLSCVSIVRKIDDLPDDHELREALVALAGSHSPDHNGDRRSVALGYHFRKAAGRVINGRSLVAVGMSAGLKRWKVTGKPQKSSPGSLGGVDGVDGVHELTAYAGGNRDEARTITMKTRTGRDITTIDTIDTIKAASAKLDAWNASIGKG